MYRYNVSCSKTICKKWTQSALDCFLIGCNCAKCNIYKTYFSNSIFKCKMKEVVIELVRKNGNPLFREDCNEKIV